MKSILIFPVFISISIDMLSQYDSICQSIWNRSDSISKNIKISGPHLDADSFAITYFKVNDSIYIEETELHLIKKHLYVYNNIPIMHSEINERDSTKLYNILIYILNRQIIGINATGNLNGEIIKTKIEEIKHMIE